MGKVAIQFGLAAVITAAALAQQPAASARTVAELEPILARLATYEYGGSGEVLNLLTVFVDGSLGSPALVKEIEARLIKFLQSGATAAGKEYACRQLRLIGSEASVPVLASRLVRPETAEMARYALARIPGPAADEALRKSLDKTSGAVKLGIINSLGERRDAKSVPALGALLSSSDSGSAEAAAYALGQIGSRPALDELGRARGRVSGPLRPRVSQAYLQCADRLAAGGDKSSAVPAYRQMIAPAEPEMIRIAALTGLAATEGKNAVPALTVEAESKSTRVQRAAITLLNSMAGPDITALLVREFPKLAAPGQVRVLTALAVRRDTSARPLMVQAVKSAAPEVRVAALAGLGALGDAASVTLLAEAAAASQGAEQAAARQSLYGLPGSTIDSALVSAIGSTSGKVKSELVVAAGERGATAAAGALIQVAREQDPDMRRSALRALKSVAGPAQVPALLDLLIRASGSPDQRDATQTLSAVLKKSQPAQVSATISACKAASAVDARLALLEAIGQSSKSEALPFLRDCLRDPSPDVVRQSILALSDWPDSAPLADLRAEAKNNANPALQVLALRGYLKLIAVPSKRAAPESVSLLREAMTLAKQPAEKKAVLSLLPAYACDEALKLADESKTDETIRTEAELASSRVRAALKSR